MRDHRATTRRSSSADREEALWAEIIRCEMDSWRPRRLPARFHPPGRRQPPRTLGTWGTLPLVVTVCMVVLAATVLAGVSSAASGVLPSLTGIRTVTAPGSGSQADQQPPARGPGLASTGHGFARPAPTSAVRISSATPQRSQAGTASEPRTTTPSPSAEAPAPLPSLLPFPSPPPTPAIVPPYSTPDISTDPPAGLSAGQPPRQRPVPTTEQ
jgi:hypothetical protein